MQIWLYSRASSTRSAHLPERWQWLLALNPMTAVISGFQWGVLGTPRPDLGQDAGQRRRRPSSSSWSGSGTSAAPSRASRTRSDGRGDLRRGALEALPHRRAPERVRNAARLARERRRAACSGETTQPHYEEIWALRDVSFEVAEGEVLGVIGRNGAGKSTLLKILTRITTPTEGRAEIRGRVGSLLEVGTGFHPELTGRENIYLNGSVLGMKRREIAAQVRRDRRVRGRREVHRHARQALLERHVRPPRVRRRGAPRAGDPARRRGARRRRRRVPAPLPRADGGLRRVRSDGALRLAQHAGGRPALRPRDLLDKGSDRRATARAAEVVAALPAGRARLGLEHGVARRSRRHPGNDLVRLRSCAGRPRTAAEARRRRRSPARRDRDRLRRPSRRRAASFRRSRSSTSEGDVAFNALDTSARWREPSAPGEYVSTAWIPGNLLNEGFTPSMSASARSAAPKLIPHAGVLRRGLVPRPGPRRGRLGEGAVHGSVARRRAPAARVDDRGALSARRPRSGRARRARRAGP